MTGFLVTLVSVLLAMTVTLALALVDVCHRLRDSGGIQHDACVLRIAGLVDATHAADVLEQAAADWESIEEQGHLKVLAREKYTAGGPSMPSIWLKDRADRYRGAVLPAKTGAGS